MVAERLLNGSRGFQPTVPASKNIPRRGATLQINTTNALFHIQFRQTVKWAASHNSPTNLPGGKPYSTEATINRRYAAGVIVCRLVRALKRPATIICRYAAKPVAQSRRAAGLVTVRLHDGSRDRRGATP
jgi:hypothetical protein